MLALSLDSCPESAPTAPDRLDTLLWPALICC